MKIAKSEIYLDIKLPIYLQKVSINFLMETLEMMNLFSAPKETLQVFVNAKEDNFSWTLGAYHADAGAECSAFCERIGNYLVVAFFKNHMNHPNCHCLKESYDLFKHHFIRDTESDTAAQALKKVSSTIKGLVTHCSDSNGEHIFYILDFKTQELHKSVIQTNYLECLRFLHWTSITYNTRKMFPKRTVMCVIGLREGERSEHDNILTIYRNHTSLPLQSLMEKMTDEAVKEDKGQKFTAFIVRREEAISSEEEEEEEPFASETHPLISPEDSFYEETNTTSPLHSKTKDKSRGCHLWTLFKSILFKPSAE